ncbi:MAG: S1/P1 nuclease [Sphingobacteriaceae bacterium]|nr:S1/P1 nuclease [Sphingobacteriaceae bacterium]
MKLITKIILTFLVFVIPSTSMAWGVLGHRIVGEIAQGYLKSGTKKEIKKILGNESVAMSSNWMDFIKSDNSFRYLGNWHYVNFAHGLTYQQVHEYLKKDTSTNIYTKINFVAAELKKKQTPMEMKQRYLRILIHLVGDVHQPMHCGRAEDSGGNDIKVTWFNKPLNLHSLWDSELIEFQQLSYTEYANAINYPADSQIKTWQKDDITKWVFESYQLSDKLYKEAETNTKYSYRYNFDHIKTLDQQLLKGGVRLAGLLNQIFAD